MKNILFTGGKGLLGSEMQKIMSNSLFPSHQEFDITKYDLMEGYLKEKSIDTIVHMAAFISPPRIETNPELALDTNVVGTANITKLCMKHNLKLIYISTDYVFRGDKGNYKEDDPVYPVNKYAWSKLGGECAVRLYNNSLIIRTTFGPNEFPYEKAFTDQWTSRESVSEIATKISYIIKKNITGTINIGGKRKTVFEYAKTVSPEKEIGRLSIKDVSFNVPADTSMDCKKMEEILAK